MDISIINEYSPTLLFFVAFYLLFSILEYLIMLYICHLKKEHWGWIIDVIVKYSVYHEKCFKSFIILAAGLVTLSVIRWTPLIDTLATATDEFRIFALILALIMLLFFLVNIRKNALSSIEKRINGLLFFIISLIIYTLIVISAQKTYPVYSGYVQNNIIQPAVTTVIHVMDEKQKEDLVNGAREQFTAGKCRYVNYLYKQEKILVKNLVFIKNDPDFSFGSQKKNTDDNDMEYGMVGMECNSGEQVMMLTSDGDWFLVSDEYIKYSK